jgi:hypothetical protein
VVYSYPVFGPHEVTVITQGAKACASKASALRTAIKRFNIRREDQCGISNAYCAVMTLARNRSKMSSLIESKHSLISKGAFRMQKVQLLATPATGA